MLFFVTIPVLILALWGQWTFDIGIQFLSGLLGSDTTIPLTTNLVLKRYSNFRKYAHPLHVKEGIITEKVFPVFSESFFGLVLA